MLCLSFEKALEMRRIIETKHSIRNGNERGELIFYCYFLARTYVHFPWILILSLLCEFCIIVSVFMHNGLFGSELRRIYENMGEGGGGREAMDTLLVFLGALVWCLLRFLFAEFCFFFVLCEILWLVEKAWEE